LHDSPSLQVQQANLFSSVSSSKKQRHLSCFYGQELSFPDLFEGGLCVHFQTVSIFQNLQLRSSRMLSLSGKSVSAEALNELDFKVAQSILKALKLHLKALNLATR